MAKCWVELYSSPPPPPQRPRPTKSLLTLSTQNLNLLGTSVLADTISSVRMKLCWVGWALIHYDWYP